MDKKLEKDEATMELKLGEETGACTGIDKKTYRVPSLFLYGSVKELTNGGTSVVKENEINQDTRWQRP